MLVKLSVKYVLREPVAARYLLVLKAEDDSKKYLKINVGDKEGEAVDCWMRSIVPPRPMTYDLMEEFFKLSKDVRIRRMVIDRCDDGIFYAKLVVSANGEEKAIDCRPSDAVAIGVRLGVPIYVETGVLEKFGFITD